MDIPDLPDFLKETIAARKIEKGGLRLRNAPIIEAVLDIDCDFSSTFNLAAVDATARSQFSDAYPQYRKQFVHQQQFQFEEGEEPKLAPSQHSQLLQAIQFLSSDARQIVQVRTAGFSFNRLAPYSTLDDYLPEIERTWRLFVELTNPIQIREIGLRYINRIMLPLTNGQLQLEDFLEITPRLPDDNLEFVSFLRQHVAIEKSTGNQATIVLTTQQPSATHLPVIFDNAAKRRKITEPSDWANIYTQIESLRSLKNRVFEKTLTDKCLKLFQQ